MKKMQDEGKKDGNKNFSEVHFYNFVIISGGILLEKGYMLCFLNRWGPSVM